MKFLALLAITAGQAVAADIQSFDLPRPEGSRHFLLATPDGKATTGRPLVILLHGHTGTARQLLGQGMGAAPLSVWLDIADREGVVLIAPDGAKGNDGQPGWNDCRADASSNPKTDDVGFIAALISQAVTQQAVDPQRVYVMGMSNGGMMAFRLGTELPDRIIAIAAVGASMAAKSQCNSPTVKLSVLIISGDADPLVPYEGGEVRFFSQKTRGSVIGLEKAASFWRALDQLPEHPTVESTFEHRDGGDQTRALRTRWGADPKHYQVELVKISGGGHVEPSASKRIGALYRSIVGAQNGDFEAAEEAWAFFQSKARD